ncbi:M3.2 [Myxoma virus]|uniref:M3.2 n=1 Tax=Myxoma virus TaxID=10273 RepID=A0A481N5A9_9POXV|nr:m3.2 [Myxoma virus]QAV34982.1 M3.2 [Myxoma virus]QAV35666.1 m3.2 [Myxoma virus]QAV35827.1 M3.2 [Myxoma virus]QAV37018.1 m3.2 [Myxoma virus]
MLCVFYLARLCNLFVYSVYTLLMYPINRLVSFMFGELNPVCEPDPKKDDDRVVVSADCPPIPKEPLNANELNGMFDFMKIPNPFKRYECNNNTKQPSSYPLKKGFFDMMETLE